MAASNVLKKEESMQSVDDNLSPYAGGIGIGDTLRVGRTASVDKNGRPGTGDTDTAEFPLKCAGAIAFSSIIRRMTESCPWRAIEPRVEKRMAKKIVLTEEISGVMTVTK